MAQIVKAFAVGEGNFVGADGDFFHRVGDLMGVLAFDDGDVFFEDFHLLVDMGLIRTIVVSVAACKPKTTAITIMPIKIMVLIKILLFKY